MKWLYPIKKKMPAACLLFVVLAIVFFNNLSERKNSVQINKLVTSIYDDRLVVENYILTLSENMHKVIDIAYSEIDDESKKDALNALLYEVQSINTRYRKTVLTKEEETYFAQHMDLCKQMQTHANNRDFKACKEVALNTLGVLGSLSTIQVYEAKSMVSQTNKLVKAYESTSQLEMAVVVIIAFIIQALVFTSNVGKQMFNHRHNLN